MVEKYLDRSGLKSRKTPQKIINIIEIMAPRKGKREIERVIVAVNTAVELYSAQNQKIEPLNK